MTKKEVKKIVSDNDVPKRKPDPRRTKSGGRVTIYGKFRIFGCDGEKVKKVKDKFDLTTVEAYPEVVFAMLTNKAFFGSNDEEDYEKLFCGEIGIDDVDTMFLSEVQAVVSIVGRGKQFSAYGDGEEWFGGVASAPSEAEAMYTKADSGEEEGDW
jgi:hypothetical protein